jgi:hypothetical protein
MPESDFRSAPPLLPRRTLLAALGLAPLAALTACTTEPGRATEDPSISVSTAQPGPVKHGTLTSASTGDTREWIICYPPGSKSGDHLPVAIAMHGYGDALGIIETMRYPGHLADAVAAGVRPFAIAAIFGGDLFWQRGITQDAGALVATDFVAELKRQGLNTSRLALTGWSMGGWGTFRLACDELHGKLRAVAALSTPCYASFDQVPGQSWMTRQQFDTNNFYGRTSLLTNLPIYMACGTSDGFSSGNLAFAAALAATPGVSAPVTDFGPGDHSARYWESKTPAQFRFLGEHL